MFYIGKQKNCMVSYYYGQYFDNFDNAETFVMCKIEKKSEFYLDIRFVF